MKYLVIKILILLSFSACFFLSCEVREGNGSVAKARVQDTIPRVYVDNFPLYYMAKRIGGEHFQICFPARGDVNPAYWMPDPQSLEGYQRADMILLNGYGYAHWIERVDLPKDLLFNTIDSETELLDIPSVFQSKRPNYYQWLNPVLAKDQARRIQLALWGLKPAKKKYLDREFNLLEKDLDDLIAAANSMTKIPKGMSILTNSYEFDYLFSLYDLDVMHFNWNSTVAIQEREWARFRTYYQKFHWKRMVCSEMPTETVLKKLEQYGVTPLLMHSCANVCAGDSFLEVMELNLRQLELLVQE